MSSERDKDARTALRVVLRAVLTGDVDGPVTPAELAQDVWNYADAMESERRKRTEAEAPMAGDPDDAEREQATRDARDAGWHAGELAAARREGRDAGLREALHIAWMRDAEVVRDEIARRIDGAPPEKFPDVASLQAVAEAAAWLQRWRKSDGPVNEGMQADIAMTEALDRALPGWRTSKETP